MKRYHRAQGAATALVLVLLLAFAAVNAVTQGPALLRAAQPLPKSVADTGVFTRRVEAATTEHLWGAPILQQAHSLLSVLMLKNEVFHFSLVKDVHGQLHPGRFYDPVDYAGISARAAAIARLEKDLSVRGARLIYLNLPDANVQGYSDFMAGTPVADRNAHADAMLTYLTSAGVPVVDARTVLAGAGLPEAEVRYLTQADWTTQAAFAVFGHLLEFLQAGEDPLVIRMPAENGFRAEIHENAFLGHLGAWVGTPFAQADSPMLIAPGFETSFTLEGWTDGKADADVAQEGGFEAALMDAGAADGQVNPFDIYLYGLRDRIVVTNLLQPGGNRTLVVGDAASLPLSAFLATAMEEVHFIDRTSGLLDGEDAVADYVAAHAIDLVLVQSDNQTL